MDIVGLEKSIEQQARELQLDKEALARLRLRYPDSFALSSPHAIREILSSQSDSEKLERQVEALMMANQGVWTSSDLCDELEKLGAFTNPDRNLRMGRLNEVLYSMVGKTITQVEKGIGRRPGRYCWGVQTLPVGSGEE